MLNIFAGAGNPIPPGPKVAVPPAGRKPAASNQRRGTRGGSGSTTTSGTVTSSTLAQRYIPEETLIEDILCKFFFRLAVLFLIPNL